MVVGEAVASAANSTVSALGAAGEAVASAGRYAAPAIEGFVGLVLLRKDHETKKDDQLATMDYGIAGRSSVGNYDWQRICRRRSFPVFGW
jgi:hypothetical protein